jgi:hypothetical protein
MKLTANNHGSQEGSSHAKYGSKDQEQGRLFIIVVVTVHLIIYQHQQQQRQRQ